MVDEEPTSVERFWSKVRRGADDECWPWIGSRTPFGYGKISTGNGKPAAVASRVSWRLANGPIPAGLVVCHRCDNPPCVNPAHLFLGTHAENMADARSKGRVNRGERNGIAKLTEGDVREIRRRRLNGELARLIAPDFGITHFNVYQIEKRRSWAHVE
jgi:hypothetical protein